MSWKPIHEANAIEIVAFAINFSELLNELVWKRAVSSVESVAKENGLTNRVAGSNIFSINLGGIGSIPAPSGFGGGSISFQRLEAVENVGGIQNRIGEQITVDRNSILYQSWSYTRWSSMFAKFAELVGVALETSLGSVAVQNIRLEYRDRFIFDGEGEPKPMGVLRAGSPLVASHVYDRDDFWHSHTGYFEPAAGFQRRLVQINVDASDLISATDPTITRRTIGITSAVQDDVVLGTNDETANPKDLAKFYMDRFQDLHKELNRLFKSIVNEETAQQVGME